FRLSIDILPTFEPSLHQWCPVALQLACLFLNRGTRTLFRVAEGYVDYWLTVFRMPQSDVIGIAVSYLYGSQSMLEVPYQDAGVPQRLIWDFDCQTGDHKACAQVIKEGNNAALLLKAHDR